MSNTGQLKILNLCKGMSLGQAMHRLEVMEKYHSQKVLELRIKTQGLIR